jgi:hypothetical protein
MPCTSFIVQGHTLPSQTFFEPVVAQVKLGHSLLQIFVLAFEACHHVSIGFPYGISGQTLLACFQEVLAPTIIETGVDAFLATQLSNRAFAPE